MEDRSQRQVDFYADPSIYDVLYTPGTAAELDLLERLESRYGARVHRARQGTRWLEPACGSGRYLRVAARRGHRLIGFDRSQAMIDYASARLESLGLHRRADLFQAAMEDFQAHVPPRSIDFAFNPVNTIRHLLRPRDVTAHLDQVARCLRPGGLYVVGISLCDYQNDEPSEDRWQGRRGRCQVQQLVQYLPAEAGRRRETVYSHLTVRRPSGLDHLDSSYELRSYDQKQWSALVRRSPLRHIASLDDRGRPVSGRSLGYQLEVLKKTR